MSATVTNLKEYVQRKSERWTMYAGWLVVVALRGRPLYWWLRWMHAHKQYFLRNTR